jgi:hypothetical protein
VAALLRLPLPLAEGRRNELAPRVLPLSPGARDVLQAFALALEAAQAKGGDLEGVRPFASKAAEHAARLAAVLTLFANPDADCVFHVMVGTVSSGWWAVIPRDRGQPFQRMVGAHST